MRFVLGNAAVTFQLLVNTVMVGKVLSMFGWFGSLYQVTGCAYSAHYGPVWLFGWNMFYCQCGWMWLCKGNSDLSQHSGGTGTGAPWVSVFFPLIRSWCGSFTAMFVKTSPLWFHNWLTCSKALQSLCGPLSEFRTVNNLLCPFPVLASVWISASRSRWMFMQFCYRRMALMIQFTSHKLNYDQQGSLASHLGSAPLWSICWYSRWFIKTIPR